MGPFFVMALVSVAAIVAAYVWGRRGPERAWRRAEIELVAARAQLDARKDRLDQLTVTAEVLQARVESLTAALSRSEAALAAERAAHEAGRNTLKAELESLTRRTLDEHGKVLLAQSRTGVESIVAPLHDHLIEVEERAMKMNEEALRDRGVLIEKLRGLQEAQTRLHADAQALTRALTGESRAQGEWGELILESLLATAGLTEGREYELQVDRRDEEGSHRRPDAVVFLPQNKAIVIDSKCSLTAFVEATRTPDEDAREAALVAHAASLRAHVKALAGKRYELLLKERTLDMVFLFVPNEAAFHAALATDPSLFETSYRQGVALAGPTTLLSSLHVVSHVWRSERQTENAQRIAQEAARLIDKLTLAFEAMHEVGERLQRAQQAWDDVRGRLVQGRGNVMQLARKIATLGARVPNPDRTARVAAQLEADVEEAEAAQDELALELPDSLSRREG